MEWILGTIGVSKEVAIFASLSTLVIVLGALLIYLTMKDPLMGIVISCVATITCSHINTYFAIKGFGISNPIAINTIPAIIALGGIIGLLISLKRIGILRYPNE